MEPVIQRSWPQYGTSAALSATHRVDLWPSLSAASETFRKNKFYARLDPRVFENIIKYGTRRIPTAIYPVSEDVKEGSYTLTTTKHQEVWTFARPNFERRDPAANRVNRLLFPDVSLEQKNLHFYRGELAVTFEYLAYLRPSVLWIFGGRSYLSTAEHQDEKVQHTGKGVGGNGGLQHGQVEKHVFENASHMAPLENVAGCAEVIGEWMGRKLTQFKEDEKLIGGIDSKKSVEKDMLVMSKKWLEMVALPPKTGKANL